MSQFTKHSFTFFARENVFSFFSLTERLHKRVFETFSLGFSVTLASYLGLFALLTQPFFKGKPLLKYSTIAVPFHKGKPVCTTVRTQKPCRKH